MDIREKLVELLMQVEDNMCDDCGREPVGCAVVAIADHLIANGVTIKEPVFLTGLTTVTDTPPVEFVPVVRCKDCIYSDDSWAKVNEKGFLICPASGMEITDNDFCSYGERRDGDG